MASETLRAILTAVWEGGTATSKAAADIDKVGGASKKTKSNLEKLGDGVENMGKAFGVISGGVALAWKTIGQGAELELAASRFDNLTASIGSTSDVMLTRLRDATNGMMSDAQLMASASQIISLGLMDTEDGVVRLASVVGELGWDMNQVILTFANNSKMRLDALGLSIADVEERTQAFVDAGMDMDKAFDMAVLEAGEARLQLIGSAATSTAGAMKMLEADIRNVKDATLEWVAVRTGPAIAAMAGSMGNQMDAIIQKQLEASHATEDWLSNLEGLAHGAGSTTWGSLGLAITGTLDEVNEGLRANAEGLASSTDSYAEYFVKLSQFGGHAGWFIETHGMLTEEFYNSARAAQEAASADQVLIQAHQQLAGVVPAVGSAFEAAMSAADEYTTSTQAAADATYEMRREGIDSSDALRQKMVDDFNATQEAIAETDIVIKQLAQTYASDFRKALDMAEDETVDFNAALFDQLTQLGASPEMLMTAGLALTDFGEEQLSAALKVATMNAAVAELAPLIMDGTISVNEAKQALIDLGIALDEDYTAEFNTDELLAAQEEAERLKRLLDLAAGSYTAHFSIITEGGVPAPPGGGGAEPGGGNYTPYATGTNGWEQVPGPQGAPFPVMLHGGEMFNVVPAGQSAQGAGAQPYIIEITNHFNVPTLAQARAAAATISRQLTVTG